MGPSVREGKYCSDARLWKCEVQVTARLQCAQRQCFHDMTLDDDSEWLHLIIGEVLP
jgi:hypothetical protein